MNRQRSIRAAGALCAIAIALSATPADAQEPLLWGSLKPGPHAVGYRTLYQLDHTRQYDPEFATDPTKPPVHKPRPIFICVWYPAKKADATPMEYRQYLDVSSDDALIAPFAKRLSRHVVAVFGDWTVRDTVSETPTPDADVASGPDARFASTMIAPP